ncbi:MAG: ABC transporter ATP-binding protein [Bacteroidota bacterium]|nr:ABC transporter ATP-binding protein [Bacteroidota bacterium]
MKNFEIICNNLSKSFSGKTIFKNLNFTVSTAQSLSITGKNGSGKSTLLKIIANLIHPSKGNISVLENNMEIPLEKRFNKLGYLSPYLNLYDELTGFENLNFFLSLKASSKKKFTEQSNLLLQKVNLFEKRNEQLKNYSSGMKQRLKIAFAIMNDPEILIMDEPGTNLDKQGIDMIYEICREQKKNGILLIATNNDDDKELCDQTLNIEDYR